VVLGATALCFVPLAQAQWGGQYDARPRYQRAPGFFDRLFGPGYAPNYGPPPVERYYQPSQVESSRAPPPRKPEGTPTVSVMVLGDSMADWLAYGLEDAFSDAPEIGVTTRAASSTGGM